MPVILAPTGRTLLSRTQIALTARQVTWFIDPEHFLRHLVDLHTIKVAAYCTHCYESGQDDTVGATFNPSTRAWTLTCACADYPPVLDKGTGKVLELHQPQPDGSTKIIPLTSVDELLQLLGWSFRCAAECAKLGMKDGIEGNNDARGHTLTINCGCTERIFLDKGRFN